MKFHKARVDRWASLGALLFAAYFLVTNIYISQHRLFWYDEIYTITAARLPDWHTIWRALVDDKSDRTPFGYFIVVRIFDRLFGPGEIGIRLPSALAMTTGMLITYDCVRRVSNNLHGLIAMAILPCTFLPYYGYEGRSYALYFMFGSAVLWAWAGKRSAVLIAALFYVGMMIHFYLILCLVPLAAMEAWDWCPWRRPSARIVGAALGAIAGLITLYPQIRSSGVGPKWWTEMTASEMAFVLTDIFPAGLFLLAVSTLWVLCNKRPEAMVGLKPISPVERAGWFYLVIPIAGWLMARLVTHAYLHRYFIGMLSGVAVGFSLFLWRRFADTQRIAVGILLLLVGYGVANQAFAARRADRIKSYGDAQERTRAVLAIEEELWSKGIHHVVFESHDLRCFEVQYYSKHPERYSIWLTRDPVPRPSLYYPLRYWDLDQIRQHSSETVLVDLEPAELETLQKLGYHPTLHTSGPLILTFLE